MKRTRKREPLHVRGAPASRSQRWRTAVQLEDRLANVEAQILARAVDGDDVSELHAEAARLRAEQARLVALEGPLLAAAAGGARGGAGCDGSRQRRPDRSCDVHAPPSHPTLTTPMTTTNSSLPPKTAEQKLADTYGSPHPSDASRAAAAPPPPSAEERLASSYGAAQPSSKGAPPPPPPPPLTAEERLARAYEVDASNGPPDASTTERQEGETPAESAQAAPRFRAPEGYQLDAQMDSTLAGVASELRIPLETMQQLVDKVSPAIAERTSRNLNRLVDSWAEETMSDPDIGGDRLDETVNLARGALTRLGTPGLRKLLGPLSAGGTGLGNNREVLRFLAAVGRALDASPNLSAQLR